MLSISKQFIFNLTISDFHPYCVIFINIVNGQYCTFKTEYIHIHALSEIPLVFSQKLISYFKVLFT